MDHKSKSDRNKHELEGAAAGPKYVLRLYVAGLTPRSTASIESVKQVCEEYLRGRYDLEVINIYSQPMLAKGEQIIAAPTLIKKLPLPLRRLIGSMADRKKVLVGLDLREKEKDE
jgi:circadian clock protein KaiB